MEVIKKKLQLFWKYSWLGFCVKQIIDSMSFLFSLIHIELNFLWKSAWKVELIMKIKIYHFFFSKTWLVRQIVY